MEKELARRRLRRQVVESLQCILWYKVEVREKQSVNIVSVVSPKGAHGRMGWGMDSLV